MLCSSPKTRRPGEKFMTSKQNLEVEGYSSLQGTQSWACEKGRSECPGPKCQGPFQESPKKLLGVWKGKNGGERFEAMSPLGACALSHMRARHFLHATGLGSLPFFFFFPLLRELSKICSQQPLPHFLSALSHTPIYGNPYHITDSPARTFL